MGRIILPFRQEISDSLAHVSPAFGVFFFWRDGSSQSFCFRFYSFIGWFDLAKPELCLCVIVLA
jgi:hypothetical protein